MKTRFISSLLTVLLLAVATAQAAKAPDDRPKLAIVVVDNVQSRQSAFTDFDRLDLAFQDVAKKRKWPVAIAAERFAANTPDHDTELRIVNQPLREEVPGEMTYRGWMTLTVAGVKHDFGIVSFRYYRRAGENADDMLEKIFRGAANAAADKIEPILWPQTPVTKP